eukprot:364500-Chlamydomonas_euryale.AAC.15
MNTIGRRVIRLKCIARSNLTEAWHVGTRNKDMPSLVLKCNQNEHAGLDFDFSHTVMPQSAC